MKKLISVIVLLMLSFGILAEKKRMIKAAYVKGCVAMAHNILDGGSYVIFEDKLIEFCEDMSSK